RSVAGRVPRGTAHSGTPSSARGSSTSILVRRLGVAVTCRLGDNRGVGERRDESVELEHLDPDPSDLRERPGGTQSAGGLASPDEAVPGTASVGVMLGGWGVMLSTRSPGDERPRLLPSVPRWSAGPRWRWQVRHYIP